MVFMPCGVWGAESVFLSHILPVSSHNSTLTSVHFLAYCLVIFQPLAYGPELPSVSAFPTLSLLCGSAGPSQVCCGLVQQADAALLLPRAHSATSFLLAARLLFQRCLPLAF